MLYLLDDSLPTVAPYPTLHPDDCVPFPDPDLCRGLVRSNMLQRQEALSWCHPLMPCSPEARDKSSAIIYRNACGANRNDPLNPKQDSDSPQKCTGKDSNCPLLVQAVQIASLANTHASHFHRGENGKGGISDMKHFRLIRGRNSPRASPRRGQCMCARDLNLSTGSRPSTLEYQVGELLPWVVQQQLSSVLSGTQDTKISPCF